MTVFISPVLEEEIRRAFEQADESETRVAFILSLLPLKPIEELLFWNYKAKPYDKRIKYSPIAVIRSLLLKDLKGIRSCLRLMTYLYNKPEELTLLGFDRFAPSSQTYSIIRNERIDAEIQYWMDFVVNTIRRFVHENGRELDIASCLRVAKAEAILNTPRHKHLAPCFSKQVLESVKE